MKKISKILSLVVAFVLVMNMIGSVSIYAKENDVLSKRHEKAFLIAQIGWWGTTLGVTIATYVLAQQFVIKYQLRRIGLATILV